MIKHGPGQCAYYVIGKWRFVVTNGKLVTCERNRYPNSRFPKGFRRERRLTDRRMRWGRG
jgi:hypothetical protein